MHFPCPGCMFTNEADPVVAATSGYAELIGWPAAAPYSAEPRLERSSCSVAASSGAPPFPGRVDPWYYTVVLS